MSVLKPFVLLAAFAACTPVCAQQSREVVSEQASSLENSEWARMLMKNLPVYQREVVVLKFFRP